MCSVHKIQQIIFIFLWSSVLGQNRIPTGNQKISPCKDKELQCVDKNKVLVKINCVDGKWKPAEQCDTYQQPFKPQCLNGDDYYGGYCIHISEPQPWSKELPVYEVDILNEDNLEVIEGHLNNKQISVFWLPVKRLEKYGRVGWTIPKYFHEKFELPIKGNVPDYVSNDCVLCDYDEKKVWLKDCNEKHRTIHIYKPESRYFAYTPSWHYSTSNTNGYYLQKGCQQLAEPKTKEDNFIIKRLVERKGLDSRIGIERNNPGSFVWSSSKTPINFTDWVSSTDFTNTVVVMTKDGWTLRPSNSHVELSVCQVDYTKYKTDVSVGLSENQNQLMMLISSTGIKQFSLRVEGLEDFILGASYNKFNVFNDYSGNTSKFLRNVFYVNPISSDSNIYYFDYILLPNREEVQTTKIFLSKSKTSREYSFKAEIKKICYEISCDPNINYDLYKSISDSINQQLQKSQIVTRVIKILDVNKNGDIKLLLHLYSNNNVGNNITIIKNELESINNPNFQTYSLSIDSDSLKFSIACLPEETKQDNCIFKWKYTELGNTYVANCGNLFVSRKCIGNYIDGATWGKSEVVRYDKISEEKIMKIVNVYNNLTSLSPTVAVIKLSNITNVKSDIKPLELHYISAIFQNIFQKTNKIIDKEALLQNTAFIVNNLIASTIKSADESNLAVVSSNDILQNIEEFLPQISKNNLNNNGTNIIVEDNFIHILINPFIIGVSGIALIKPKDSIHLSFKNYEIKFIHSTTKLQEIIAEKNLELATYVPKKLLKNIGNITTKTARISINLFYKDTLFVQNKTNGNKSQPVTKIIDVSILGYSHILFSPIPIIAKTNESTCGYWDFGTKTNKINKWRKDNKWESEYYNKNYQICYFGHLTNFAMLLGKQVSKDKKGFLHPKEHHNLKYITAAGYLLSMFGICAIGLTALIFKNWRQIIGSKVVLNVCACILLQMILMYTNFNTTDIACAISGSLLHYSVLCGFSWSLVMAILHYLKFVKVIKPQTPHLLLKASVVGWVLPIIPVASAVTYNYLTLGYYLPNLDQLGVNMCYPQGMVLYLSLLLPIALIVSANLIIFFIVLYNVTKRPNMWNTINEKELFIQQIKLAVFLFFLLGLTWISGLLAILFHSIIIIYFFSATASLQGFVLFLFYVIFDKKTRVLWLQKFRKGTPAKNISQVSRIPQTENVTKNTRISISDAFDWNSQLQAVINELNDKIE